MTAIADRDLRVPLSPTRLNAMKYFVVGSFIPRVKLPRISSWSASAVSRLPTLLLLLALCNKGHNLRSLLQAKASLRALCRLHLGPTVCRIPACCRLNVNLPVHLTFHRTWRTEHSRTLSPRCTNKDGLLIPWTISWSFKNCAYRACHSVLASTVPYMRFLMKATYSDPFSLSESLLVLIWEVSGCRQPALQLHVPVGLRAVSESLSNHLSGTYARTGWFVNQAVGFLTVPASAGLQTPSEHGPAATSLERAVLFMQTHLQSVRRQSGGLHAAFVLNSHSQRT